FFLYFCTGACHAPHQSPPEWRQRYRGAFDAGWDEWRQATFARQMEAGLLPPTTELSPRPEWVPAWESLSADEKRLYARYMEAFAGFMSHTDDQVGRLLRGLGEMGKLDNTLLFVLSDNGASSEGGPGGSVNDGRLWNMAPKPFEEALARIDEIGGPLCHNNYPWGWTVAGNTPFRRWKREVHEGGVADPLIVHWPAGVPERGGLRRQYVHAIDLVPTVLEVLGVEPPEELEGVAQSPIEGTSFAHTFADASAESRHRVQYYEMFGCRAIYRDGWKAVTYHPIQDTRTGFDEDRWELYHVDVDPSECHDLAGEHPELLRQMVELWWAEAGRYQVLPLDNRPFSEFVLERPPALPPRQTYVYYPGAAAVPEGVAANLHNRAHRISAEVEVPPGGAEGVLIAQGSGLGGWSLFVKDGRLAYVHNYVSYELHRIGAERPVAEGAHRLEFRYVPTGQHQGRGELWVDGDLAGQGEIPRFTPHLFSLCGAGLTCGYSDGLPVTPEYRAPFAFTGRLSKVTVEVDGTPWVDAEAQVRAAVARQ
ncbi:MAG TPA: sulfatase-like hydrolase/transferase, partial [Acidimicrobiales bacterium]|nr:sulfatase-like hydrolase/transferase [Acidimicrobiales bacterium]